MRIIYNGSCDPYFNLALEEHLLTHTDGDMFMLWQNGPSVIIGKNQNTWAETDPDYITAHGVDVVRRMTGGGAVFHDLGNVNYSFITGAEGAKLDFGRFAEPVIAALAELGVEAEMDSRNDIVADGKKISGNAQCVLRGTDGSERLLHHGTLLYSSDMEKLSGCLRTDPEKLKSKGIKSVRSRVGNIKDIGKLDTDTDGFIRHLIKFAERTYGTECSSPAAEEIAAAEALRASKYATWEWNWGASPEHGVTVKRRFPYGSVCIGYTVKDGVISSCSVNGDFFGTADVSLLVGALTGVRAERGAVAEAIPDGLAGRVIDGACTDDLVSLMFDTEGK